MAKRRKKQAHRRYFLILKKNFILSFICFGFCAAIYSTVTGQIPFYLPSNNDILSDDAISLRGENSRNITELSVKNNSLKTEISIGTDSEGNIINMKIPVILQNPELPSGCEATAAAMLLSAYGYDTDKEEFAAALPWCELEQYNGKTYCCNPRDAFAGSPYSAGYGVFSDIVTETMQLFINQQGGTARAVNISGASKQDILNYLEAKTPVCIWVTIDLKKITYKNGWYIKRGNTYTDQYFQWPAGEHCMLLTGYDQNKVYVHDPLWGKTSYDRDLFFQRYNDMGSQAIVILEGN